MKLAKKTACVCAGILAAGCQSVGRSERVGVFREVAAQFDRQVVPFLAEYCHQCHGSERPRADVNFESIEAGTTLARDGALWDRVAEALSTGMMPPEKRPQPPDEARREVVRILDAGRELRLAAVKPEAGRVTVRRLNRAEYNNTVRDLLGVTFQPAADFPLDDSGYGFDTIGDVLSVSPLLAEKYLDAAERITAEVVKRETGESADRGRGNAGALRSDPTPRAYLFTCDHEGEAHARSCAERVLKPFARRVFRRPPTREEVARLTRLVDMARENGDSFERGVELAAQAALVSPHFLFRVERDRGGGSAHRLSPFELATRLSYFLWSSMPDDELLDLAEQGRMRNPRVLRAQVQRMLRDSKSRAFAEDFGGQWLEIRNLAIVDPDPTRFPSFNNVLRAAMAEETTRFVEHVVRENRPITDFIDADYTFLNGSLAMHYGIEGVSGDEFRRVALDTDQRGGVLSHASVLTVTSYPTRTSPVLRGLWVLENLLDAPTPPPPPNVPSLEDAKVDTAASLRERLEAHRADPSCASCHDRIDPLGFGLENFDAIGAWRDTEADRPIDNSGTLPGGERFAGPVELKRVLLERKHEFARCLAEKMLTYALGRGLEPYDEPTVRAIVRSVENDGYGMATLVYEIVRSLPFQQRRREAEDP